MLRWLGNEMEEWEELMAEEMREMITELMIQVRSTTMSQAQIVLEEKRVSWD
jgi:hypothetical protein